MSDATSEFSGPVPPFAYDGQVGEEKLGELLAMGAEQPYLDYKSELDLKDPVKKLDFIKDCAAMMNLPRGGYLVIGANGDGTPAQSVAVPTTEMFDSAALTQIVKGYVDAPIDIRARVHNLRVQGVSATMAVIYVAPPFDGIPAAMSKAGTTPSPGGGKPIQRFEEGMVFTREGSSNALVSHRTWGHVLANYGNRQRSEARQDVDALVRRTLQMIGTGATPALVVPDLAMDAPTFSESVRAALTQDNSRLVRSFLITAKNAYLHKDDDEAGKSTLDRVAAVAAEAILFGDLPTVTIVVDTLVELYESYLIEPNSRSGKIGAQTSWLDIILRVMAVGAAAVRGGLWEAIPTIVLRKIGSETYFYRSWIRHALTEASRAGLLIRSDESPKGGNLIALSADLLLERPEIRPDVPAAGSDSPEVFLDSLCQFDFLWCCLSLAAVGNGSPSAAFYPSCSAYHQTRIVPALRRVESDLHVRAAIFGDIADHQIADAIVTVIDMAAKQSWNYGGWWDGVRDLPAQGWTKTNATTDLVKE